MDASSENEEEVYDDVSDEDVFFEQMLEEAYSVPYKCDFDGTMVTLLCIWCKHRRFTDQEWGDEENTAQALTEGEPNSDFFCSNECFLMYNDFYVHTDGHT